MRLAWLMLLLAGAPMRTKSDLSLAVDKMLSSARQELLETGACTPRFREHCERGTILSFSDGYTGGAEYFDPKGVSVGFESWSCTNEERRGARIECPQETNREPMCKLALTHLRRTGTTIEIAAHTFEFDIGTFKLELPGFEGTVTVDADASRLVVLALTTPDAGAKTLGDLSSLMNKKPPETLPPGVPIPLPARVFVEGGLLVSETSHFVPKDSK